MSSLQQQLHPMPYGIPYDSLTPPAPPRYYEGLPLPPDEYSVSGIDKRTYEQSVNDFLWRTSSRHTSRRTGDRRSSSRDHYSRYRDRR